MGEQLFTPDIRHPPCNTGSFYQAGKASSFQIRFNQCTILVIRVLQCRQPITNVLPTTYLPLKYQMLDLNLGPQVLEKVHLPNWTKPAMSQSQPQVYFYFGCD